MRILPQKLALTCGRSFQMSMDATRETTSLFPPTFAPLDSEWHHGHEHPSARLLTRTDRLPVSRLSLDYCIPGGLGDPID